MAAKFRGAVKKPQVASGRTPSGVPIQNDVPSGNDVKPVFRFAHATQATYCLSKCDSMEISALVGFFKRVEERTWEQIYDTAGKGIGKHGLGYETVSIKKLPPLPETVPKGIQPFELRANQVIRVFAYRENDTCNLLFFDPKHKILG
jgi:hypothetical protein